MQTQNSFDPLDAQDEDDVGPPELTDSESEAEKCPLPPPIQRWGRVKQVKPRRRSKRFSPCQCCEPEDSAPSGEFSGDGSTPSGEPSIDSRATAMTSLIEVKAESLNSIKQEAEEWEELEFMVDSGAGHTVVGPTQVKAVQCSGEPNGRTYKLADGSHIPHMGSKTFVAATDNYSLHQLKAHITEVDSPLLSVSQLVDVGNTVVFSPTGSYVDVAAKKGVPAQRISLKRDEDVFKLKMWVPKGQPKPFQGPAQ